MKKIGKLSLLSAAMACSAGAQAYDRVMPKEPGAYEPFTIEVDIRLIPSNSNYVSLLEEPGGSDGELLVGYLWLPMGFMGPLYGPIRVDVEGLAPGTYTVKTADFTTLNEGDLVIEDTGLTFTVAEAPPMQHAHAFFNEFTEHYFVTASDEEADTLHPEDGWEIVDLGFNVWHADEQAPSTAVPVCRFYSSQVNSHFYTGDEEECTKLQEEDHGWEYEGIAFQALVPGGGACLAGTEPVWRLFNDRVVEKDSNHRFVASSETYRAMVADGWVGEGVAFCSPHVTAEQGAQ